MTKINYSKAFSSLLVPEGRPFKCQWKSLSDSELKSLKLTPANTRLDEDVLIKTNIFAILIRLQKTSSRRLDQDQYIRLGHTSSRRLQDVFKTSSRRLAKTSSRHLQDVLQRCLQDVFKTYYQVKLFFVTQFQDVFETYSKRFLDVLLKWLSTGGLPRSPFWEIYGQCRKFPRVIKLFQKLIFHFTTPFSGCLQRRI